MASNSPHTLRRIFVSHSSSDNAFGYGLTDWLRTELGSEYEVFYDSHGGEDDSIPAAAHWQDVIQAKLVAADVFILIETVAAMASQWVKDEFGIAWSRKNSAALEFGPVIVPVLRESCDVDPWLGLIQRVDFRVGADEEEARARILAAVRSRRTYLQPLEVNRPPFDLSMLHPADRFIGRATDVEWVMNRLTGPTESQLANIAAANGQGGIGKTALAAEVVRRLMTGPAFRDGIAVVDCRSQHSEVDALGLLQTTLSRFAPGRQKLEDTDVATLADVARHLLGGKYTLVVLDNVEPDLPASTIIAPLRAAGAAMLLTSRAPIAAVPTAANLRLGLLSEADALAVFSEAYGRTLDDSEKAGARRIVVALGRHTLAVKLAAANAATQQRSLVLLATEFEQNPLRDAWLENSEIAVTFVLKSSATAMSTGGQRLFTALGAFASPDVGRTAALVLAESLGDDEDQAERSLRWILDMRLADVATVELPAEGADCERLRFHPLIQAYIRDLFAGRRRLSKAVKWGNAQRELAFLALETWYAYYSNAIFGQHGSAYLALMPDENNLVGALGCAVQRDHDELVTKLCNGMRALWRDTGRLHEGLLWLPLGISAAAHVARKTHSFDDHMYEANLSAYYADLLRYTGKLAEALEIYERNLIQRRELGDRAGEGLILASLGHVALLRDDYLKAKHYFEQSLAISREQGNYQGEGADLSNLGQVALAQGSVEEARRYFEQSRAIVLSKGDRQDLGAALSNLGQVALAQGLLEEAESYFNESLYLRREFGDQRGEGTDLTQLGQVALRRGQLDEAEQHFRDSLPIHRRVSDSVGEDIALSGLGQAILLNGQIDEAEVIYKQLLSLHISKGDRKGEATDLSGLGLVAGGKGQTEMAKDLFNRSISIRRDVGDKRGECSDLHCLAVIAEEQGDLLTAERLYRDSLALSVGFSDGTDAATLYEILGVFLLLHKRGVPGEGCRALNEAMERWKRMGRKDRVSRALWILSDLGCK